MSRFVSLKSVNTYLFIEIQNQEGVMYLCCLISICGLEMKTNKEVVSRDLQPLCGHQLLQSLICHISFHPIGLITYVNEGEVILKLHCFWLMERQTPTLLD